MSPTRFELNVSLPHDPRLAGMVAGLAEHAAQHAGCRDAEARAFGRTVEATIRAYLENTAPSVMVPVVVRRNAGPVEVLVDRQRLTLDV